MATMLMEMIITTMAMTKTVTTTMIMMLSSTPSLESLVVLRTSAWMSGTYDSMRTAMAYYTVCTVFNTVGMIFRS
ncbi:hypothetical protein F5Y14DRAFT_423969 [Nemania sp. NC0429]|nr:hypothetical protein F5Y14DRAFT_423969 [Nemania sp. NC0429]